MKFVDGHGQERELPDPPPMTRPSGLVDLTLDSAMKRHLALVLEYCDGNLQWAAEELGVNKATVARLVADYGGLGTGRKYYKLAGPVRATHAPRPSFAQMEVLEIPGPPNAPIYFINRDELNRLLQKLPVPMEVA